MKKSIVSGLITAALLSTGFAASVSAHQAGDIIVFDRGDIFVAHRLIDIKQDRVLCKGDGFATYDNPINFQQVVGKVTHRIRKEVSVDLSLKRYVWFGHVMLLIPRVMGLFFSYSAKVYHKISRINSIMK